MTILYVILAHDQLSVVYLLGGNGRLNDVCALRIPRLMMQLAVGRTRRCIPACAVSRSSGPTIIIMPSTSPSREVEPVRSLAEGSNSANALLLTLLGEFVLPSGGSVWTATLLEAMASLGVEPKTTRQALARTSKSGRLEKERHGRRTRWTITPMGKSVLDHGYDRIYHLGIRKEPWDNTWLIVIASVPEADRHLRYRLRTRLAWVGLAPIGPGIWLSPWASHESEALETLDGLGLASSATSFVGHPGAFGNINERIHEAWDLGRLMARYEDFIDRFAATAKPADDRAAFVALTRLVHAWRQFPIWDPGLPDVLLPPEWNGERAARTFHACHRAWKQAAGRWWNGLM